MRIARHGPRGHERPIAAGPDGRWHDLSPVAPDVAPGTLADIVSADLGELPVVEPDGRVGPPLAGVGKIVCIGLNYRDHAAETGAPIPSEPIMFMKAPDTVVGPDDETLIPRNSRKTDWEVELAVVVGATARYLASTDEAAACIAGYAISDDISEREFQLERGGQWDKGKNCETFNPLGPWLVTADEVGDPRALGMRLWVNGELRQNGTTADMIFDPFELVRYLSQFMTLYPGDVINTGTPAGVALGMPDQPFLRAGDLVEIEIDGLGRQSHRFAQA